MPYDLSDEELAERPTSDANSNAGILSRLIAKLGLLAARVGLLLPASLVGGVAAGTAATDLLVNLSGGASDSSVGQGLVVSGVLLVPALLSSAAKSLGAHAEPNDGEGKPKKIHGDKSPVLAIGVGSAALAGVALVARARGMDLSGDAVTLLGMPAAVTFGLAAARTAWHLGGALLSGLLSATRHTAAGSLLVGALAGGGAVLPWAAAYEEVAEAGVAASFRGSSGANRGFLGRSSATEPGAGFLPAVAGLLGGGGAGSQSGGGDLFEECAEELADSSDDASRFARSRGLSKQDAEDVAIQAIIDVCLQHQATGIRELVPYYMRAVSYEAGRIRSSYGRSWEEWSNSQEQYVPEPKTWHLGDRAAVRRAFGRLSEGDQQIVLLSLEKDDHGEVAVSLGISPAAARKSHSRAIQRLRDLVARGG